MTRLLGWVALLGAIGAIGGGCGSSEEATDVKSIQAEAQANVPKNVPAMSAEDMAKIQQGQMGGPAKGGN